MLRRWFRQRDESERYRSTALEVTGEIRGGKLRVEVTNVDPEVADHVSVVMLLNMPRTSERPRLEETFEHLAPAESVEIVADLGDPPVRGWWFATWECRGTEQRASGSLELFRRTSSGSQ